LYKKIEIKHPGKLHRALHEPAHKHLSLDMERKKLTEAKKDHNVAEEKELVFAINARGFKKK
jgi:hypothetical protein